MAIFQITLASAIVMCKNKENN